MAKKPQNLSELLRAAIRQSGLTHYAIGKSAGLGPETIDRFVAGRDIRISTASKIAEALGYELKRKGE